MTVAYPTRETGLDIQESQEGPCVIVRIAGELDMNAVPRLRAELDAAVERSRPPLLVLDMTRTTFCDSLGLGLLVGTLTRVRDAGGRLALVVVPGMISRLLTITNLDHHFEVYGTTEEATAALKAS
ncbi:STAS domain-containing protein [Sphaerisporangium sp. TRM90804]|uniref:STAS domain-containing protein n=1 Tax=Sphaerisporangium sp. TRM90804 TaxID=3031113 RepID=UPI002449B45A|nr:STAS domain-containing protein [Sphaerisporangium sp. TRM90804]MDH2427040.1 STAS domain-containing protein [Sphaerisporangium sp. TRM90804]